MTTEATNTLELRDYLRVLRRHKWIIIVSVIVCVGISLFMSLSRDPRYAAQTRVLIQRRLVDTILVPDQSQSATDADRTRANEIQLMSSPDVRARVEKELGRVPDSVTFQPVEGTDVVEITANSGSPKDAAASANAFAKVYSDVRTELATKQLDDAATELQSQIDAVDAKISELDSSLALFPPEVGTAAKPAPTDPRVSQRNSLVALRSSYSTKLNTLQIGASVASQGSSQIISEAQPPKQPINKNSMSNVLAGLAIGLVIGIALAFLREYLDDSVKTKEDLESAAALTVVGIVPALTDWKKREATPLISLVQPRSPAAEAYRSVRTSVEFLSLDQPIGSLQVTSALAAEGKTSTLANLAVTFARAGQRVIVLCCDLRRPRVHEFFGLSNRVGFTSVLLGDAPIASVIQPADRELPIGLVASGPLPPNPAELLASNRAVDAIEELDRRCDLLLIDSPPVLPVTDGLVISGLVDAVLLVASAGSSTKRGVRRATELLRQVDAPLIGAILNGAQSKLEYGYSYGDNRYYLDEEPSEAKSKSQNGSRKAAKSKRQPRVSARTGD